MTQCREATKSPVKNKDGSWDRTFLVADVSDAEQALGLAAAAASTTFLGCNRDDEPDMHPFGYSLWEVVYHYTPDSPPSGEQAEGGDEPTSQDQNDLDAVIEFDGTGGTAHVTQCVSQTDFGAESGLQVKNSKCIGVDGDSIQGTDKVVPKMIITLSRRPPVVTGEYIGKLHTLTGRPNVAPYIIRGKILGVYCEILFDAEELLFLGPGLAGSSLTGAGGKPIDGKFVYKFEASKNRVQINLGAGFNGEDMIIPSKKGHEYLWVMHKQKELTTPPVKIPVPHIAFVAKLDEPVNFAAELGF